jgi:hypothetical protein
VKCGYSKKTITTRRWINVKKVKLKWSEIVGERGLPGDDEEVEVILGDDGSYIGMATDSGLLSFFEEHGIEPQSISGKKYAVASIGFSEKEQKWYGWSHRAVFGFGVGSEVKEGVFGFIPSDIETALAEQTRFWSDRYRTGVRSEVVSQDNKKVSIETTWRYTVDTPNEDIRGSVSGVTTEVELGRGRWKAETLEDAKQMAIDFAEGVS